MERKFMEGARQAAGDFIHHCFRAFCNRGDRFEEIAKSMESGYNRAYYDGWLEMGKAILVASDIRGLSCLPMIYFNEPWKRPKMI